MGNILSVPVRAVKYLTGRYVLEGKLRGHTDAINCLALSKNGQVLASGGYDGLRLWDMTALKEMAVPPQRTYNDAISAVSWIIPNDICLTFCYGTSLGMLVFIRETRPMVFEEVLAKRLGSGVAITCITSGRSDRVTTRIATASRDGLVQCWIFASSGSLDNIFSLNFSGTIPIGLIFADSSVSDVHFFDLVTGNMYTVDGDKGKLARSKGLGGITGHVAVNMRQSIVAVDTIANEFALYNLKDGAPVRTYATPARVRSLPRQLSFGEGGRILVGGGDNGAVCVFEVKSGARLETLKPAKGLLQTVHTHWHDGISTVLVGSTVLKADNNIWIWKRKGGRFRMRHWQNGMALLLNYAIHLLVLVAALGFVVQNMQVSRKAMKIYHRLLTSI
ncbi:WD40 repeat-like protein [Trametopsis cervina]|nr:WD40 repeat-like protein [Trametopsis cervina]